MDGYLHVAKKVLRLSERYEGEMECKKEKKKRKMLLVVKFFWEIQERKELCNINLPLQRNSSGNNPCNCF